MNLLCNVLFVISVIIICVTVFSLILIDSSLSDIISEPIYISIVVYFMSMLIFSGFGASNTNADTTSTQKQIIKVSELYYWTNDNGTKAVHKLTNTAIKLSHTKYSYVEKKEISQYVLISKNESTSTIYLSKKDYANMMKDK